MIKKIVITFLFVILFSGFAAFVAAEPKANTLKPLKIEQNSKYGNFDKNISQDELKAQGDFGQILAKEPDKKEPSIMDVLKSLLFVVFLILLTGWIYMKIKKINPEQLLSGKFNKLDKNTFKIVSSLQLGGGKAIYLIEINDKQLIVGTTASSVNLLAQMDKNEKTDEIPEKYIEKLFTQKEDNIKNMEE